MKGKIQIPVLRSKSERQLAFGELLRVSLRETPLAWQRTRCNRVLWSKALPGILVGEKAMIRIYDRVLMVSQLSGILGLSAVGPPSFQPLSYRADQDVSAMLKLQGTQALSSHLPQIGPDERIRS